VNIDTEAIYTTLCRSSDPAAALDRMADDTLAALLRDLEAGGVDSGIPGIVAGLCEREAARRFVIDRIGREGAVGEG
jgi:hypothetical protein